MHYNIVCFVHTGSAIGGFIFFTYIKWLCIKCDKIIDFNQNLFRLHLIGDVLAKKKNKKLWWYLAKLWNKRNIFH